MRECFLKDCRCGYCNGMTEFHRLPLAEQTLRLRTGNHENYKAGNDNHAWLALYTMLHQMAERIETLEKARTTPA